MMEHYGVASAEEVMVDNLADRLRIGNDCCRNGLRDAMPDRGVDSQTRQFNIEIDVGLLQVHCDGGNRK